MFSPSTSASKDTVIQKNAPKRQPGDASNNNSTASNFVQPPIMRTQSMSCLESAHRNHDRGIKLGGISSSSVKVGGPQKRSRDELSHSSHGQFYQSFTYGPQHSLTDNSGTINRCYTFDVNDRIQQAADGFYPVEFPTNDDDNDQSLLSMLKTIDWSSNSRSPDCSNRVPTIDLTNDGHSPLSASPIAMNSIEKKPQNMFDGSTSCDTEISSSNRIHSLPSTEVNNSNSNADRSSSFDASEGSSKSLHSFSTISSEEVNSSILVPVRPNLLMAVRSEIRQSTSSDDSTTIVAVTDEENSTSGNDSKYSLSLSGSPKSCERKGDSFAAQKNISVLSSTPFEGNVSLGGGSQSQSQASSQSVDARQRFLTTPAMGHTVSPYVFEQNFRMPSENERVETEKTFPATIKQQSHQSNNIIRSHYANRSPGFGLNRDSNWVSVDDSNLMGGYFVDPRNGSVFNSMSFDPADSILRTMSSTDELNAYMPALSLSGRPHTSSLNDAMKSKPMKRRGRPRKVLAPSSSLSPFGAKADFSSAYENAAYRNDLYSRGPQDFSSRGFASDAKKGLFQQHRSSPIPELSSPPDQSDPTRDDDNLSPARLSDLLIATTGSSTAAAQQLSNHHRLSPFSEAAAALDIRDSIDIINQGHTTSSMTEMRGVVILDDHHCVDIYNNNMDDAFISSEMLEAFDV